MKNNIIQIVTASAFSVMLLTTISSCNIEQLIDPNNPSLEGVESDATVDELNNLVAGMEASLRFRLSTYVDATGIIGREYYRFSGADPRFTSDLLGKGSASLDNNTFYIVNPWSARYRSIRQGWIIRNAVANTSAPVTNEEMNGYNGFAKTLQAYEMMMNLNMTYQNGIRVDVEDPSNLGGFLSLNASEEGIMALLDDAYNDLTNAGDDFLFSLSSGFAGFDTPAGFAQFNRALKARISVYNEDYDAASDALTNSFFDLGGPLSTGVYHVYSTSPGDELNDLFTPANSSPGGNARVAHNSFVADAEAGDLRLSKVGLRTDPAFSDDLTGDYDVLIYGSNLDAICMIRNEELILIYAEVKAQMADVGTAVSAIDAIRSAAGLPGYSGSTSTDDLINEILHQRRYSLFAEGQRWIDMRRYGKLGELPIDRVDDDVWLQFPIPADEGN